MATQMNYSPSSSLPGTPRRRLSSSSRRGSTSAPDPWGKYTTEAPASSTSRLHIVKLPPPTPDEELRYAREHSRRSSWGPGGLANKTDRLSFAQPVVRPSSPDQHARRIHPSTLTGTLAPQQLYDLAMASIHPQNAANQAEEPAPTPAVFTPLPANHYLPFIVRSSEVTQLLSRGPPRRLWALIKQIYPKQLVEESRDPTKWPFSQLERWMFKVDRHEVNDKVWVYYARKCISRRSEPLWERLKNALGVPPELEADDDEDDEEDEVDVLIVGKGQWSTSSQGHQDDAKPQSSDKTDSGRSEASDSLELPGSVGPSGLALEPIYPEDIVPSPVVGTLHESDPTTMAPIGEEDEEEEEKSTPPTNVAENSVVESVVTQSTPDLVEDKPEPLDASRMVGITFVSHSKHVPLAKYMDPENAPDDQPLFPGSFASVTSATPAPLNRRNSRGSYSNAFILEEGSTRVGGPRFSRPSGSDYAVSVASDSDFER